MTQHELAGRGSVTSLSLRPAISLDTRQQIAMAARFLRSIRPEDGDLEITLHEMARRLEQVVEASVRRPEPGSIAGALGIPPVSLG